MGGFSQTAKTNFQVFFNYNCVSSVLLVSTKISKESLRSKLLLFDNRKQTNDLELTNQARSLNLNVFDLQVVKLSLIYIILIVFLYFIYVFRIFYYVSHRIRN